MKAKPLFILLIATIATAFAEPITPVPEKISCAVKDRQDSQIPDRVNQTGWVGTRIDANERNRLVKIDPARLLEGYRLRPAQCRQRG